MNTQQFFLFQQTGIYQQTVKSGKCLLNWNFFLHPNHMIRKTSSSHFLIMSSFLIKMYLHKFVYISFSNSFSIQLKRTYKRFISFQFVVFFQSTINYMNTRMNAGKCCIYMLNLMKMSFSGFKYQFCCVLIILTNKKMPFLVPLNEICLIKNSIHHRN